MANPSLFSLALFVSLIALTTTVSQEIRKPYIVYMNKSMKPLHFSLHEYWYVSLINEATSGSGSDDESLLLYTYDIVLDGFAAKLSRAEAASLESMEGCLAVIPSSVSQMHTTRSPQFLGLGGSHNNFWPQSHYGKDVIVGVIDTGIWPESEMPRSRWQHVQRDSVGVASHKAVSMLKKVSTAAKQVGVAGLIWATEPLRGAQEIIDGNGLPSISVGFEVGNKIKAYINSTSNPTAAIKPSELTVKGKAVTAPLVASFSGRGPSREFPHILKPDVIAPGLDILAAVKKGYEFKSGTSMSCPHVSGLAALIRGVHPSWSPAAIKSALMTSAYIRDNKNQPIKDVVTLKAADPFALGAGHVNPAAAMDPGLVYDLVPSDYIHFLCTLNYTDKQIALLMDNHKISCPRSSNLEDAADLNYPSFTLFFNSTRIPKVVVRRRTVTNVGAVRSTYKVQVEEPSGMKVSVEPETLEFTKENQKLNFRVIFQSAIIKAKEDVTLGEISWNCIRGGTHVVRSPVVVQWRDI
ncbi:subtilisin-like protease SBT1.4 [Cryptomeria japonica]|uniref:subtilisin-like protease SBT1.4 n=1 Tax=Cryptomeria japonica TaxID=3369 RepID=UPI0027DA1D08|nr:subtilisin-like protease SBT1.4 [Cryptomeria japonica]